MSALPRVVSGSLGGSALARAAVAGSLPADWLTPVPGSAAAWKERIRQTVGTVPTGWQLRLHDALGASGVAASRLAQVAARGGGVVTTGQQPGLFGGPLYTLSKALSALELADALERETGIPIAPVFWAATDDADFVEASFVWLRSHEGAVRAALSRAATDGVPMSDVPLGDLNPAIAQLREACGSAADATLLGTVEQVYVPGATVGASYVSLMRSLLEPLGISVLDASHDEVVTEVRPVMARALESGEQVSSALAQRERDLRTAGFTPQVALLPELSLCFSRTDGVKQRVAVASAGEVLSRGAALSPNVLLRPVAERSILPTVAYVAGPGELSYFAQVSAVSGALTLHQPLGVPRWSGTVIEPDVDRILTRHDVQWNDLVDEHAVSRAFARRAAPRAAMEELEDLRGLLRDRTEHFKATAGELLDPRVVDGALRNMSFRVDRLERRLLASVKRREGEVLRELAVARGALFPNGLRQERAHSFIPLLVRHGAGLMNAMRLEARRHAESLVSGVADLRTG